MFRSLRLAAAAALVAALAASSTALGDAGSAGGVKVLDAGLVGIPQAAVGQVLQGVTGGGLPWRLERGSVRLFTDGRLQVTVEGLVLATGGLEGTNPIPTGRAILSCDGAVAAMSDIVPFSPEGDAKVNEMVSLPGSCLAPAVFFAGVTGAGPRWFAVTGW